MRFDVLTLFPEIFTGYLGESLLNKAIGKELVQAHVHNLRDWANDKHNRVDDRPFGGGPGMVIRVQPVVEAIEKIQTEGEQPGRLILLSPQGRTLDQPLVEEFAQESRLTMICGRYEGFDQRVIDLLQPEEISLGDFILNGGEVAAMAIIDTVIRLIPGVLGDEQSAVDDSFSEGNRLLEFPQYTRPREYRGLSVPEVLLGGNHQEILTWRKQQSLEKTKARRADLLDQQSDDADQNRR
ncbi:tRNA (guanosine(37)-N1)-methyltransferase TrmD [Blastopirellula marina]|uniref:tRNA (guanine-N(1)-)-methyltransferase n=1 Tax=Blastopirellula marina TaxID=124 RepID=A0A2S8GJ15_9BACT|nr:tRNA (guanosine(37)-N1)-methyltransferase TrmD [Blastopirellula marina]PQO44452.1 tRNA (guanosine(37)-N1)-methyltransferase TrmD [Blastopirellula marina]